MRPDQYLKKLRALCKELPESGEKQSWGHPNFTAGGKMFAAYGDEKGPPSMGIATSLEEQAFLIQDPCFSIAKYVGKHGWVSVDLDEQPDWDLLEDLLRKAHARVLAKAQGKGRKKVAKKKAAAKKPAAKKTPTKKKTTSR